MSLQLKRLIKRFSRYCGYEIQRVASSTAESTADHMRWLDRIRSESIGGSQYDQFEAFCAKHFLRSKSQLFQDLLVLFLTKEKRDGFFVEFGATDGIGLSNTYLLEAEYGWNGILAEPARCWQRSLRANRTADISLDCVWSTTGEKLQFRETEWREISTINQFSATDLHAKGRETGVCYEVSTISLPDLLASYNAPSEIDYLSIDTEGSEFEILNAHDFNRWRFNIVTVEHNFTDNRERIRSLLEANGYCRILDSISQFDDWYLYQGGK